MYLDYAATTPVDPAVQKVMLPFLAVKFGNASSLHSFGREGKTALEESRGALAKMINASASEIYFTGSDTESNNLILKGVAVARALTQHKTGNIVLSAIEHDSVVEITDSLKRWGYTVTFVPVDAAGRVNPLDIEKTITKETFLVSVIFASNEVGTVQPIQEIGKVCRQKGVLFHTDASQAFGKIPIDVKKMNIDLLSASSHKIYGPKGAALAYIRKGIAVEPLIHGGGQERGVRGGTENVAAIVGFAKAAALAHARMGKDTQKIIGLKTQLLTGIQAIRGAHITGKPETSLPNIINVWFEEIDGEQLVAALDMKGVSVSTGSACSTVHLKTSHILQAMGLTEEQANGSLRISLGRETTREEVEKFLAILFKTVTDLRKLRS